MRLGLPLLAQALQPGWAGCGLGMASCGLWLATQQLVRVVQRGVWVGVLADSLAANHTAANS